MERLTERYTATEKPDGESYVWVRNHDYIKASEMLADYEDTGLTPEQIRDLKDRDTAKTPVETDDELDMYACPSCDMAIGTMGGREYHHFCLNCGQRIEWEE